MQENFKKLFELIVDEFQDHIDQVVDHIKDSKDYENACLEAIQTRIGQIDNIEIWGELNEIYTKMLDKSLEAE